jgi:hypothetical protein
MSASKFYSLTEGTRDTWICNRIQFGQEGLEVGPLDYLKRHSQAGGDVDWIKLYHVYMSLSVTINSPSINPCNHSASDILGNSTLDCYVLAREVLKTAFPVSNLNPTFPPCGKPNPQIFAPMGIDMKEVRRCYAELKLATNTV